MNKNATAAFAKVCGISLAISGFFYLFLAIQASNGVSGTEYSGMFLVPIIYLLIFCSLGSLLGTSIKSNTIPPAVRRTRLIFNSGGLAIVVFAFLIGYLLNK